MSGPPGSAAGGRARSARIAKWYGRPAGRDLDAVEAGTAELRQRLLGDVEQLIRGGADGSWPAPLAVDQREQPVSGQEPMRLRECVLAAHLVHQVHGEGPLRESVRGALVLPWTGRPTAVRVSPRATRVVAQFAQAGILRRRPRRLRTPSKRGLALIAERDIATIYGNYDYAIARDLDDCGCAYITPHDRELGQRSVEWTLAHTDQASKDFMRDLPFDLHVQVGDRPVHLVHGPRAKSTSTSSLTAAAIVAATVALSACGGSTSYPANVQTIFRCSGRVVGEVIVVGRW